MTWLHLTGNRDVECAFCGEENEILVDVSGGRRPRFTEDCDRRLLRPQLDRRVAAAQRVRAA